MAGHYTTYYDYPPEGVIRRERVGMLLYKAQGKLCALCGGRLPPPAVIVDDDRMKWSQDHCIPQAFKGPDRLGNLLLAHRGCNADKSHRMPTGCELIWLLFVNAKLGVEPTRW